jgi:hypothetical protein
MRNRYMVLLTTLAFLGLAISSPAFAGKLKNCDPPNPHPSCGDDPVETIVEYTAELTAGAFVFNTTEGARVVDVTTDPKANVLRSGDDLNMVRPSSSSGLEYTWNSVFNPCAVLLTEDSVDGFFVGEDDWSIQKAGGVRVIFYDIMLSDVLGDAEVTVQLIGNEFDFIDPFVPVPGLIVAPATTSTASVEYTLYEAAIWGSSLKGIHPKKSCQPPGGGGFQRFLLSPASTLLITATRKFLP